MSLKCSNCKAISLMDIELFFGFGNLINYKIGDKVQWIPRKEPQNGGRPPNGNLNAKAYTVCPNCGHEIALVAKIHKDTLMAVELITNGDNQHEK
jgi:DNA-directed RNA polymerase subunit RPC12/RpoP